MVAEIDGVPPACCAHLKVSYQPVEIERSAGVFRERWVCDVCGAEFWPKTCLFKEQAHLVRLAKQAHEDADSAAADLHELIDLLEGV